MYRLQSYLLVLERAHFKSSSSFIEFQTVEFEHVSSSTLAWVFPVLAQVIRVFHVFFELEFSQVWVLRVKAGRVFEFGVARSSTCIYYVT